MLQMSDKFEALAKQTDFGLAAVLLENEQTEEFWQEISIKELADILNYATPESSIFQKALKELDKKATTFEQWFEMIQFRNKTSAFYKIAIERLTQFAITFEHWQKVESESPPKTKKRATDKWLNLPKPLSSGLSSMIEKKQERKNMKKNSKKYANLPKHLNNGNEYIYIMTKTVQAKLYLLL